ncbi:MAG: CaiB/BaiF CoA transferase family protein [Acidimicrobiales bacterium]
MGPLTGLKIVELFCIGPGPYAGMLLSDMGADVILVDREVEQNLGYPDHRYRFLYRNRRSVRADLKSPDGVEAVLGLIERADAVIEGFRPGVAERLGLGPEVCLARNPKLVYGRMTGYGQSGPLAGRAGYDANFISLTGALWAIGEADRPPVPPLILAGDLGGGGAVLALGMVSALWEAARSGRGQVVDAAIVDGALNLMAYVYGNLQGGTWNHQRQANLVDGGDWRYGVHRCADDRFLSVALLQPKFVRTFLAKAGVTLPKHLGDPDALAAWPAYRAWMADLIATRTRDEWVALFDGDDDCVQPVLDLLEAPTHPHLQARRSFVEVDGTTQPAPAPRFDRTPSEITRAGPRPGEGGEAALRDWGLDDDEMAYFLRRDAGEPIAGGG